MLTAGPSTLLVDGMNVVGARADGWWRDRHGAFRRLLADLQRLATSIPQRVVLVLEGAPAPDLTDGSYEGVEVRWATRRGRDAADDLIVALVKQLGRDALVVSSDRALRDRVGDLGAEVYGARWLLEQIPPPG